MKKLGKPKPLTEAELRRAELVRIALRLVIARHLYAEAKNKLDAATSSLAAFRERHGEPTAAEVSYCMRRGEKWWKCFGHTVRR